MLKSNNRFCILDQINEDEIHHNHYQNNNQNENQKDNKIIDDSDKINIDLLSDDYDKLKEAIPEFMKKARESSKFEGVDVNLKFTKPEIRLEIDREKYMINFKGNDIVLARKEFELLALLAAKAGKVFTRDEILERVWGNEVVVGDRTIDVHIRKLREKIGEESIKTVKGIGYKFDF